MDALNGELMRSGGRPGGRLPYPGGSRSRAVAAEMAKRMRWVSKLQARIIGQKLVDELYNR